jgi:2-dehydro-3-deoxy-L-fuconate 4-dehydrogenase
MPMTARLAGKTAMVTAAGQGIGRAIALAFADEGAYVFASSLDPAQLADLARPQIETARLDVTDRAAIGVYAREVGALDILVNCAGWVHHGTILEASEGDWDRSVDLNLTSMYSIIRAVLPAMLGKGGGAIINIASVVSSLKAAPNRCAYAATKAGVIGLTKAVAIDFVQRGVRCNAICPGTIDTPSLAERIASSADTVAARRNFIQRQPMGRLGTAAEVAETAIFLASDAAAFITGTALVIDGGMSL